MSFCFDVDFASHPQNEPCIRAGMPAPRKFENLHLSMMYSDNHGYHCFDLNLKERKHNLSELLERN